MPLRLDRDVLDINSRARAKALLERAPWCWPTDPEALRRARALAGEPRLRPGSTVLVTVNPRQTSIWALRPGAGAPGDGARGFGPVAVNAWARAALALPKALPFIWRSVEEVRTRTPAAHPLDTWIREPGSGAVPEPALDGDSFGLAFLLSIASHVLRLPLPIDLVALATVDADGNIGGVGNLPEKIEALHRLAPRIRRIIVSAEPEQARLARSVAVGFGLDVLPVHRGAHAVTHAFDSDTMAKALVAEARDTERWQELVRTLFEMALKGRGEVPEWRPVRAAAALARSVAGSEDEKRSLEFAEAMAARHENNDGVLPLPDPAWLASYPMPVRLAIVRNYVQQAADARHPDPAATEDLARRYLVRGLDASSDHLKLQGALARLLAVRGGLTEALALQEDAALGFIDRMDAGSAAYPLSEWFRLAGVLGDAAAFERATAFRARLEAMGALADQDQPYLDLAWCKARVLGIGRGDPGPVLQRLAEPDIPYHVRFSAVRWKIRWLDERGRADDADALLHFLDAHARSDERQLAVLAERYAALARLDRAIAAGDEASAAAASATVGNTSARLVREHNSGSFRIRRGLPRCERVPVLTESETVIRLIRALVRKSSHSPAPGSAPPSSSSFSTFCQVSAHRL